MTSSSTKTPLCPECDKPMSFDTESETGIVYRCRRCGTTKVVTQ